jgi:hypothetical protein
MTTYFTARRATKCVTTRRAKKNKEQIECVFPHKNLAACKWSKTRLVIGNKVWKIVFDDDFSLFEPALARKALQQFTFDGSDFKNH